MYYTIRNKPRFPLKENIFELIPKEAIVGFEQSFEIMPQADDVMLEAERLLRQYGDFYAAISEAWREEILNKKSIEAELQDSVELDNYLKTFPVHK